MYFYMWREERKLRKREVLDFYQNQTKGVHYSLSEHYTVVVVVIFIFNTQISTRNKKMNSRAYVPRAAREAIWLIEAGRPINLNMNKIMSVN